MKIRSIVLLVLCVQSFSPFNVLAKPDLKDDLAALESNLQALNEQLTLLSTIKVTLMNPTSKEFSYYVINPDGTVDEYFVGKFALFPGFGTRTLELKKIGDAYQTLILTKTPILAASFVQPAGDEDPSARFYRYQPSGETKYPGLVVFPPGSTEYPDGYVEKYSK